MYQNTSCPSSFVHSCRIYVHHLLLALLFLLWTQGSLAQPDQDVIQEEQEAPTQEFPPDSLGRRTPRGTVSGFINAVAEQNYSRAGRFFNMNPALVQNKEEERLVKVLQYLLDKGGNIMPYSWISESYEGREDDDLLPGVDRVGVVRADGEEIDLFVERTEGPDGGPIWLFSAETIETIAAVTVEESLFVDRIMPDFLQNKLWGGVPIGQWLALLLIAVLAYFISWAVISLFLFLIPLVWRKARVDPTLGVITALSLPFRIYFAVWIFVALSEEIGISIILRQMFSGLTVIIGLVAFLIFLWSLSEFIGDFSKRRMSSRGNVSGVSVILFLKRAAKIAIIVFGVIAILGILGFNVTTGLAALGIGGIALALGAQKTVENFVGSVTLITDQPVRVGDFCKVGETVGTVEKIGMRSTKIRTNERTIVTIPNGDFSSEKIENYAFRDRFLFTTILGLRYETTPDQIRYLLVEIRTLLYSHPKMNPNPARVRFLGLGTFSLDLEIWSYINAINFDEYLEVKEDLLLRIMDIIAASGTELAFPSQTLYLGRDKGLAEDKGKEAADRVKKWKENKELQLPNFDPETIKDLKDSIPYPPEGSVKRKEP